MDPLSSGPWAGGLLFAAAGGEPLLPTPHGVAGDILVQIVAGLVLLLLLLLWARFVRQKKGRRKRKHHHHRRPLRHEVGDATPDTPDPAIEAVAPDPGDEGAHPSESKPGSHDLDHRHARRRRRRKDHRPRNPTLAETGGLPPRRDADQPPTAA